MRALDRTHAGPPPRSRVARTARVHFAVGGPDLIVDEAATTELVGRLLAALGPLRRVLLLPPDIPRLHSGAGELTSTIFARLSPAAEVEVMSALGTHSPMVTDRLIRRHGCRGTQGTLATTGEDRELATTLAAAAHLIRGASAGRFRVTCATDRLSREQSTAVGYAHRPLSEAIARYRPARLRPGVNVLPDGEPIFLVPNPAVRLWGTREKLREASSLDDQPSPSAIPGNCAPRTPR